METTKNMIYLFLTFALLILIVSACAPYAYKSPSAGSSIGPPPWAPAHGFRAKYKYRYYPSSYVYFDVNRGIYFYRVEGLWMESYKLPPTIYLNVDNYVILAMDVNKPYKFHKNVIKKHPRVAKKQRKIKGKSKKY
ncbi:MAG: hypothetical protein ACXACY_30215 [Candidatus Hodarchaeales archaeon]|jgi:hypothetical protein